MTVPEDLVGFCAGRLASGAVRNQLHRDHGADAAHVADDRESLEPGAHPGHRTLTQAYAARRKLFVEHHVDDRQGRGTGNRVATKRSAQAARIRRIHELAAPDDRAQWQAAAQCLGEHDQIRLDTGVLDRKHLAGAAEPGLDLVGDQGDLMVGTELAKSW